MIQSFLIPVTLADGGSYLVYDTVFDNRHIITGCGVGRVIRDDAELTPVGQQTLHAVCSYAEYTHGKEFNLVFLEIPHGRNISQRIAKGLKAAHDKSATFFICRDHTIYDAAVAALNVTFPDQAVQ
jgi:hypothetical protein